LKQFLDFALGLAGYCYVMEKGSILTAGTVNNITQDVAREYLSV